MLNLLFFKKHPLQMQIIKKIARYNNLVFISGVLGILSSLIFHTLAKPVFIIFSLITTSALSFFLQERHYVKKMNKLNLQTVLQNYERDLRDPSNQIDIDTFGKVYKKEPFDQNQITEPTQEPTKEQTQAKPSAMRETNIRRKLKKKKQEILENYQRAFNILQEYELNLLAIIIIMYSSIFMIYGWIAHLMMKPTLILLIIMSCAILILMIINNEIKKHNLNYYGYGE